MSARDRLEQALARIADPKGEGARACLTVYAERRARPRMRPMRARRPASRSGRSTARSSASRTCSTSRASRRAPARDPGRCAAGQSRRAGGAAAARGRRGDRRQDQHERVRVLRRRHEPALRHAGQSGGPHARARRLVLGRGGRRRRPDVRDRDRHRHRRLDPHSRRAVRHRRLQAEPVARADRWARSRSPITLDSIGPIARTRRGLRARPTP